MLRSIEIENEYGSEEQFSTDVGEPIVGQFRRQFVRDRIETEGYGFQIESGEHSDFDASNAYADREQRQDWDFLLSDRTSNWTHTQSHRPKGTYSALSEGPNGCGSTRMETRVNDLVYQVGLKDFNGNQQRIQRALGNRSESERDTNLVCNWLPLSAKFRRQQSEPSSSMHDPFFPDATSSYVKQHPPATSDGIKSSENELTFTPSPVRFRNRAGSIPQHPVSPYKGSYLHPFKDSSIVTQGQVVSIQVQLVGRNSDSGSEKDSDLDSRMINAQLTPREFGYGCSLTFGNDEEEVFNVDDVSTLPAFQTALTGRSTKDSGIHLSEIDEQNVSPISPLSGLDSPNDSAMRLEERRSGGHRERTRDPVHRRIHVKSSTAGVTVYLPHQSSSAGHSGIGEQLQPLTSTPRYEQNRIPRKSRVPGVERVRSMSEHRVHTDSQIPGYGLPIGSAHESKSRRYKEMGGAKRASSNERKRGGQKRGSEGRVKQHERNCDTRYVRNREESEQRKLRDLQEVIVVNAEVEERKNNEGKVRGRSKQRKTRDVRHESVLHPADDLDRLARFFRKQSSEGTPDSGRNDKRKQNTEKPATGLKGSPNATCKVRDNPQQLQADLRNQHKIDSSGISDNLEARVNNVMGRPSRVCLTPRDPGSYEPTKRKSTKTKKKDRKEEDPMRIGKLSPSPDAFGSSDTDGVAVLDHGQPPEGGRGSKGSGDLRTPASSGVGADGGSQQRSRSVSDCVAGLEQSISVDGASNVELQYLEPIPSDQPGNGSTTDGVSTGAKFHVVDEQLKKELRLESASCATESSKNALQTSDKSPRAKPNPVKLPKPKLPVSVGAAEITVSSKVSQDLSLNVTDQIPTLPPPPGFGDEATNFPPIASRTTVSVERKPPVPLPKLKPRIYQKKSDQLSPQPLQLQPSKLPWIRKKPSPPVPSKITPPKVPLRIPEIPLPTRSRLQIASTGKECNENQNKLISGDSQTPPAITSTAKPPHGTPDAAQDQQAKTDDSSKDIDFVVMAETFRKNYINTKLVGNTAIISEPHVQHEASGSSIQSVRETLQAHEHESEEKAVVQNAVNNPERTPKTRSEPVAIPIAPPKMESVPIETKAESGVTAELPKGRLVEAKDESENQPKLELLLAPDNDRIPCSQVPFCLPAPPGFGDSTDTIVDRTDLSQSPLQLIPSQSSVMVDSGSMSLVNTGRYLTCSIDTWSTEDVGEWLESLGLGEHRYRFVHHSIDGIRLKALDRNALVSLEMTNHLHRMHLERARMVQMRESQQQSLN